MLKTHALNNAGFWGFLRYALRFTRLTITANSVKNGFLEANKMSVMDWALDYFKYETHNLQDISHMFLHVG